LEAQIATGGLIDPRANHRVPISVAYHRGLFDERMNRILEDPSDDTKGFFDPNTQVVMLLGTVWGADRWHREFSQVL